MAKKPWSITQLLRFPAQCHLCNHYHKTNTALCEQCKAYLMPLEYACEQCAHPLPNHTYGLCGQCIKYQPVFDKVVAPYAFEEPLRSLVHAYKYKQALHLQAFMVELMLSKPPSDLYQTQCLIPMPIHKNRLKKRGFNQASLLAKGLSKHTKIPYKNNLASKIKDTPSQAELNQQERRRNLRDVFVVEDTDDKHVTIIDDLLTTGSSANELAKTLKKQGVNTVTVWCCARASLD